MGRKNGGRSDGGSSDFRHRIEGFGNAPMPPPISDSFEDRLHNALSNDDTVGSWYNSALAAVDSMVTSFDENVNAIFDSIEETVEAIVGDDDPAYDLEQRRSNENQPRRRHSNKEDDGERSGIDWQEKVAAICEEGDLETFVLMVRSQCANIGEEKEIGGLLSDRLLQAERSGVLRVLYVMQAVEEGELPVVMGVIREKCADKLEQLKSQTLCRSLVTQILGPGGPATSSSSGANDKQETKAQEETQPKAKATPAPKAVDLLDFADPAPKKEATPPAQKPAAPPKAKATSKASSTAPADLLDSSPTVGPTTRGQVDLLDMAPIAPIMGPQSGDLMSLQVSQPSTASSSSGLPPSSDPFGGFDAFQSSLPTTTPATQSNSWANFGNPAPQSVFPSMPAAGMRPPGSTQTATSSAGYMGGVQLPNAMDNFDPNARPIPNAIGNGPPMKMTGVTAGSMGVGDFSALASSGFSAGVKPLNSFGMAGASAPFVSGRSSQAPAKKDIQLDDVLSSELAKMQSVS